MTLLEIVTETVDGARVAAAAGAGRIELCAGLGEGGTTPSAGAILGARRSIDCELTVLLRPRRGDFLYSAAEYETLRADLGVARNLGADAVALGVLASDGAIDRERTARLVDEARPLAVTFHRAFDVTRELEATLDVLIELGVERVLTSGGAANVDLGRETIGALVDRAAGRIGIMAGGGVTERNVRRLVLTTGVEEIHCSASSWHASPMEHRADVAMGTSRVPDEYELRWVEERTVRRLFNAMR
ncbi:MAG: copper homeostasis protein CutC [Planctomycetota bacterium]